ncbi:MAG: hypothetical protein H6559_32475 [Lewinellaceae bacterium]|nr:hypothetical protein [Lewinellaceae bacterium]
MRPGTIATITIDPVDDLPTAVNDLNQMTNEDTPLDIDVLANDDFGGDTGYVLRSPSQCLRSTVWLR